MVGVGVESGGTRTMGAGAGVFCDGCVSCALQSIPKNAEAVAANESVSWRRRVTGVWIARGTNVIVTGWMRAGRERCVRRGRLCA